MSSAVVGPAISEAFSASISEVLFSTLIRHALEGAKLNCTGNMHVSWHDTFISACTDIQEHIRCKDTSDECKLLPIYQATNNYYIIGAVHTIARAPSFFGDNELILMAFDIVIMVHAFPLTCSALSNCLLICHLDRAIWSKGFKARPTSDLVRSTDSGLTWPPTGWALYVRCRYGIAVAQPMTD
jgi:hypothetical protein